MIRRQMTYSARAYFVSMYRCYRLCGRGRIFSAWHAFRDVTGRES